MILLDRSLLPTVNRDALTDLVILTAPPRFQDA